MENNLFHSDEIKSSLIQQYPYDKRGCNVLMYASPPRCKTIWDMTSNSKLFGSVLYKLLPFSLIRLLKGLRQFNDDADHEQIFSTKFAQFTIVVQKQGMQLPSTIFYTLDFDIGTLRQEYQAQKYVLSFSSITNTNILDVQSVFGFGR